MSKQTLTPEEEAAYADLAAAAARLREAQARAIEARTVSESVADKHGANNRPATGGQR